ncbi:MAG: helix-turn-helix transcriptional regulator [Pirellulales bacterium]
MPHTNRICLIGTDSTQRIRWRQICERFSVQFQVENRTEDCLKDTLPTILVVNHLELDPSQRSMLLRDSNKFVVVNTSAMMIVDALNQKRRGIGWIINDQCHTFEHSYESILLSAVEWFEHVRKLHTLNNAYDKLTKVEIDVLQGILLGLTNVRIAEIADMSVRTIEARKKRIFLKLQVNSVAALVRFAVDREHLEKRIGDRASLAG